MLVSVQILNGSKTVLPFTIIQCPSPQTCILDLYNGVADGKLLPMPNSDPWRLPAHLHACNVAVCVGSSVAVGYQMAIIPSVLVEDVGPSFKTFNKVLANICVVCLSIIKI